MNLRHQVNTISLFKFNQKDQIKDKDENTILLGNVQISYDGFLSNFRPPLPI